MGLGLLDGLAAVCVVEVLEVEVQAAVGEELPPPGPHEVRHLGAVELLEDPGHVTTGPGVHPRHDQRAVHGLSPWLE